MKHLFYLSCILFFTALSCKKRNNNPTVDSNIAVDMIVPPDSAGIRNELTFKCTTSRTYECCNYLITDSVSFQSNHISVYFTGILKQQPCLTSSGSAGTTVNLGPLANGTYELTIVNGGVENNGTLTVSDKGYTISFGMLHNISFIHENVLKVPAYTIWGNIEYRNASQNTEIRSFLDSVEYFGAQPYAGTQGYYFFYSIDASNNVTYQGNNGAYFFRNFIYDYPGDINYLKTLVKNYGLRYGDSISIDLRTYNGKEFLSYIH